MTFFRKTLRNTLFDYKRNEEILEEFLQENKKVKLARTCNKNKQQQDAP